MELRARWARYLVKGRNLSPSTSFTYEQHCLRWERIFQKDALRITPRDVQTFMLSDFGPSTKNGALVALKSLIRFAIVEGVEVERDVLAMTGPRQIRGPRPTLHPDELAEVLAMCSRPNQYRVIWLGSLQGLRVSDSARITAAEWRHPDRLVFVNTKSRRSQEIPVHPMLQEKREEILAGSASRDVLKHVCRSMSHVVGIPFTTHTLRATFGVMLSEVGIERDVIAAIFGHAPMSVLAAHYVPVRYSEMQRAFDRHAAVYKYPTTKEAPPDESGGALDMTA